MLAYDPNKRITAADAYQDPWIVKKSHKVEKDVKPLAATALKNLKKFSTDTKLKQATMAFIVNQLVDEKEKKDLKGVFQLLDKNGDGRLSKEEIIDGYEKACGITMTIEELSTWFDSIDLDKSGTIDYTEFLAAALNEKKILSTKNIENAFKAMDKDGSGSISVQEIRALLAVGQSVPDEIFKAIVKEVDTNGDGEVSFDEFKTMLLKITSSGAVAKK